MTAERFLEMVRVCRGHGLSTRTQARVLFEATDGETVRALAERLGLAHPAVRYVCNRSYNGGLMVSLVKVGVFSRAREIRKTLRYDAFRRDLGSSAERAEFVRLLDRLADRGVESLRHAAALVVAESATANLDELLEVAGMDVMQFVKAKHELIERHVIHLVQRRWKRKPLFLE